MNESLRFHLSPHMTATIIDLIDGRFSEFSKENLIKGESKMENSACGEKSETRSATVFKRLEEIHKRMESVCAFSVQLSERLFGPSPSISAETGKSPQPIGFFDEANSSLSELIGKVNSAHNTLQSILNRIG
jgi:hypothetical protein